MKNTQGTFKRTLQLTRLLTGQLTDQLTSKSIVGTIALMALLLVQEPLATADSDLSADPNLTQAEAEARARMVDHPAYHLNIQLSEANETFLAEMSITFELKTLPEAGAPLFLDLRDGAVVHKLLVNDTADMVHFQNHRLALTSSLLKLGTNSLVVNYTQKYFHDGRGLHKFRDPEDQQVYLYSQFEAFDANAMFPCFDQPDLKGTMLLDVTAPKAWTVISTTREEHRRDSGDFTIWNFPITPKMSTYLFSLHAGPYRKWESSAGNIPLRLFSRRSIAKYVVPKDWFTPTQQGLKFYGEYFASPYPFKKYDQVIAPEFNAGAMENVAAVTFSEWYISRGKVTHIDRQNLAETILHEMAHMWFGDLVTMRWWNGLWLNESFATYMSNLALTQATEFKLAWISFFNHQKTQAYLEDQRVTTHPVDSQIADTNSAFANFDSITYGKGASAIKQLSFFLGPDQFRDGIRTYIRLHSYQNTQLEDFISALEQSSQRKLGEWAKTWLESAGVDTVESVFSCQGGKLTQIALKLTGPGGQPSPRPHRLLLAVYDQAHGPAKPAQVFNVEYQGPSTSVSAAIGSACPTMILPNHDDQDYVKVKFDQTSLDFVRANLAKIDSGFTRSQAWIDLYEMVRDTELAPGEFLDLVRTQIPIEQDPEVFPAMTNHLHEIFHDLRQTTPIEKTARLDRIKALEHEFYQKTLKAKPGSDWQVLLYEEFADLAESQAGRDQLVALLNGKAQIPGLKLDVDQRWHALTRLAMFADPHTDSILKQQSLSDRSERGIERALAVDAAKPDLQHKRLLIKEKLEQGDLSYARKRSIMWSLFPPEQDDLRGSLSGDFYDSLPKLLKAQDLNFVSSYARSLLPTTCSTESANKLNSFIDTVKTQFPSSILKTLRNGLQEDQRCARIREHQKTAS